QSAATQPLPGLRGPEAADLRAEVLLALTVGAGLTGVGVKVVGDLAADLDLGSVDLGVLHPLPEQLLRPAIAVGVAVVEEGDALVEGEAAHAVAVFLRAVSPPVDAEDPAAQGDGGDFEIGIAEFSSEN